MRTRTRAHVKVGSAPARAARRRVRVRDPEDSPGQGGCPPANPKFPPSRLVGAFDQVVEPLITEITCLRSHELRLFHLVSAISIRHRGELRAKRATRPRSYQIRYAARCCRWR